METMTRTEEQTQIKAATMVRPGTARMRELTPAQRRAVMFAQQQVLMARAAKKAKDDAAEARRRMWDEAESAERAPRAATTAAAAREQIRETGELTLREAIGRVLRDLRSRDHKTLREVSEKAGVSLGYLSEVERGQKEASSELLSSIAEALGVSTAQLLRMVADRLDMVEA
ncbi:XRE family transcriptional regulator [Bifidobacterium sp. UTCIF-37]|uniref:DNA binding protein n=1 Tax=Bifidobacterium callitrichos DSM 23973 TaxID=1437609 RepID=A0A087A230_9BIFI|nr:MULTISPECIES: helix-turn-helix transcriptional regulator [Bifidobacterium]KFI52830.1 DNA binding protein [Bifidobacterium callitrichos DSM 23973]TPF86682.1 XRE family transcriptional regulator [Bifidobacterium sp. UTCIF-37]TPF89825.1 XRE family transcriptional regulator [Bifidobacterium sp. UTCIF-38]